MLEAIIKKNIHGYWKGKKRPPFSDEWKRKLSESKKGSKHPCFGKKGVWSGKKRPSHSAFLMGKKRTPESIKKQIESMRGFKHSKESKEKMKLSKLGVKNPNYGKKLTCGFKKGQVAWNKGKKCPQLSGSNCSLWRGGVTPVNKRIRECFKYRQWRSDVFTRDNFTCVLCNKYGGTLNADHVEPFAKIITRYNIKSIEEAIMCDELWNINNGRTLCIDCHKKTDTYLKHKKYD